LTRSKHFLFLWILLAVVFMASLILGSGGFIWNIESTMAQLLLVEYRLPAAIMAVLSGAALAVCGLMMQNVFRNPLAGPYVLGISSGASLGIAIVVLAGASIPAYLGVASIKPFAATIGALLMLFLNIAVYSKLRSTVSLLIFGMLAGHFVSAIVEFLQYMASGSDVRNFVLWGMGNLHTPGWIPHMMIAFMLLGTYTWLRTRHGAMDVYQLGDAYAQSLGLNIHVFRRWMLLLTAVLAGTVTSWCGPLSFVGLVIPHMARLFLGSALHQHLLPGTVMLGALFMLTAHFCSMLPAAGSNLPVNVVCSIIGAPLVMFMLVRNKTMLLEP
jgi:iron complex transport system permease protein